MPKRRRRRTRTLGSPPLPSGRWPRGRAKARFCRALKRAHKTCGGPGSPCREAAADRALAAGCPWAVRRVSRSYSGRLWRD